MSIVVTIGRHFGSGGRELGKRLAERLNIPFYDEELVDMAADKSNMHQEVLKEIDEKATNSFLYALVTGGATMRGMASPLFYEMPINDKLFIAQSDVIKGLAAKGSCVIVGRCADYVLEDTDFKTANLFLYAPMGFKMERIARLYKLSPDKAKERIIKTEKSRKTYYNYYTNKEWGNINNYDLCINTAAIGMDKAVDLAEEFVKMREQE